MPQVTAGGLAVNYELTGREGTPVVMFSNSLGTDLALWDAQAALLEGDYRVLRYDTCGHGGTVAREGEYTIDRLGQDALALLDELGIDKVHVVGLSLGGMIGQWLGINAPQRILSLTLCATACSMPDPAMWEQRITQAREQGVRSLVSGILERWLTEGFRQRDPQAVSGIEAMLGRVDDGGYAGCAAAVRDLALCDQLRTVTAPTLLIAGRHDGATPPARLRELQERIDQSELIELDAAHLVNIEAEDAFNQVLVRFLGAQTSGASAPGQRSLFDRGYEIRSEVLGASHVQRTFDNLDEFTRPYQEIMTSYCWGSVWGRPGLSRKTRSMLNLAMLTALNKPDEFKLHVRAALTNGLTREEIMEVLLQTMIYCGVPAANAAFRDAREVFKQVDADAA